MSVFYISDKKYMIEVYGDEELKLTANGQELKAIKPNTVDAAQEKHVPVATYDAAKNEVHVQVGSVAHPMTEAYAEAIEKVENGEEERSILDWFDN